MKRKTEKMGFFSPSLDRLDPQKGYIKGNVVWCLVSINSFKQELNLKDFVDFMAQIKISSEEEITKIANFHKE